MTARDRYRKLRREDPLLPARYAWGEATAAARSYDWKQEGGAYNRYTREVGDYTVVLTVDNESIYPMENDGYGHYVEELRYWPDYGSDWRGNYPPPVEDFPLGLPYTAFRYTGPGWTQGEGSGYFVPDNVEGEYDYYRRNGQSRSVAWDLTRAWVEETLARFFSGPLTYATFTVTVLKEGIELGVDTIHTSYIDDADNDIFAIVDENDLVGNAIADAEEALARLVAKTREIREAS